MAGSQTLSAPPTGGTSPRVRARKRRSGGIRKVRDGVWRVDIEVTRDAITGHRRRISRQIHGTREDAEVALARLLVAGHEKRLPSGGTSARSVRAALELYVATIESGRIEMAPRGLVTVRSAVNTMASIQMPDGREFGRIRLSKLTWMDIEQLYASMRSSGRSAAWTRRCATVLTQAFELARKRGLLDSNPARGFDAAAQLTRQAVRTAQRRATRVGRRHHLARRRARRRDDRVGEHRDAQG